MNRATWRQPTSPQEAFRRAAGRRRYNAQRQRAAAVRRDRVAELMGAKGYDTATVAAVLGVSLATVRRDLRALRDQGRPTCPACGHLLPLGRRRVVAEGGDLWEPAEGSREDDGETAALAWPDLGDFHLETIALPDPSALAALEEVVGIPASLRRRPANPI